MPEPSVDCAQRPLAGVHIVDLSRYLPGPFCTLQLMWLGAEVTVVEQPPHGDAMRLMPPLDEDGVSLGYRSLRRGCTVEMLDLRTDAGRARLDELVDTSDVLLESFRPGVAARLGADAATLRARHPRLVYASLSGYGQSGPWMHAPGHDLGYEALAGILDQSGTSDEVAPPPVPIADLAGGLVASTAICAALVRRARTGEGCVIDVALTEAALAMQAMQLPGAGMRAAGTARSEGMLTGGAAVYGVYRCADDRYISVAALEPQFLGSLLAQLERPDLTPLYADPARQDELRAELAAVFMTRDAAWWDEHLCGADGGSSCVVRVYSAHELAAHPQHAARGSILDHGFGPIPASPYVVDGVRSDQPTGSSRNP